MSDATYSVYDNGDLHRYRTEIPNIIFRLGLTPYELTLYAHLKQTAGDGGQCWKSTDTLAKETGMSTGTISKAKDGLVTSRPELAGKSLIEVREESGTHGGRPRHYITLTDVWPENMTLRGKVENPDSTGKTPSSCGELGKSQVHVVNLPSSCGELRYSIKKEPILKKEPPISPRTQVPEPAAAPPETGLSQSSASPAKKAAKTEPYDLTGFIAFWAAHPRKVDKKRATAAWQKLRPNAETQTAILLGIEQLMRVQDWDREDRRFVALPATYLNNRRWEDELTPPRRAAAPLQSSQ